MTDEPTPRAPHPDLPPFDSDELSHILPDLRDKAVPITEVVEDAANLRLHTDKSQAQLRESYAQFQQRKNVVVQVKKDGTKVVRAGNGTLRAIGALGKRWIAAAFVEEDDVSATAYAIADNRTAELSKWDLPALHRTLEALDTTVPGVEEDWVRQIAHGLGLDGVPPGAGQDPGAGAVPPEPASTGGILYHLGPHLLMCGDSTEAGTVNELLEKKTVAMVWTDPPFGVTYGDKNRFLNACGKGNSVQAPITNDATPEQAASVTQAALANACRHTRRGGAVYCATAYGADVIQATLAAVKQAGFEPKWILGWVKDNHVLGRADYMGMHENVVYGWKTGAAHFFSGYFRRSVFEVARPKNSDEHPTMKPVELIEPMILNSSKKGEVVYDPFTGSGSTLIACARTDRVFVGMELEPGYCDVVRKRWGDYARERGIDPGPDAL